MGEIWIVMCGFYRIHLTLQTEVGEFFVEDVIAMTKVLAFFNINVQFWCVSKLHSIKHLINHKLKYVLHDLIYLYKVFAIGVEPMNTLLHIPAYFRVA